MVNLTKNQGVLLVNMLSTSLLEDQCQKDTAEQQRRADQRHDPYHPRTFFMIHTNTFPSVFSLLYTDCVKTQAKG